MKNFPPLRLAVLTGLVGLKDHLDDLDDPTCPYDEETKTALRKLLAPTEVEKIVEKEVRIGAENGRGRPSKEIKLSEEDQNLVLTEIKKTMAELGRLDVAAAMDTNAKIQIAKTRTGLLDTLLKMMERHTTVKRTEDFKEIVIGVLDDLVSEKDREVFLRRIEPFR